MTDPHDLPDWEKLLAAERHLQQIVPGSVLVGGTAAALHARHRESIDGDHVVVDLRPRFDEVLADLEAVAGWETNRIHRPVLILGSLSGVLTGIRQLRRVAPLETEQIDGLRVPTLPEMARIKAWLLATRNTVRDYLDTVVLCESLGEPEVVKAFGQLDRLYPQDNGNSVLSEVADRLAAGSPTDQSRADLASYRGLRAPWSDWGYVVSCGRKWAEILAEQALLEVET